MSGANEEKMSKKGEFPILKLSDDTKLLIVTFLNYKELTQNFFRVCKHFYKIGMKRFKMKSFIKKTELQSNFYDSIYNGHLKNSYLLLKNFPEDIDPTIKNNMALRKASEKGDYKLMKELLKHEKIDPTFKKNYAFRYSTKNNYIEIVKLIDPSCWFNEPIFKASYYGHTSIVKLLMKDKRVDPSDKDNRAYTYAAYKNHTGVVKELLKDKRVEEKRIIAEEKRKNEVKKPVRRVVYFPPN